MTFGILGASSTLCREECFIGFEAMRHSCLLIPMDCKSAHVLVTIRADSDHITYLRVPGARSSVWPSKTCSKTSLAVGTRKSRETEEGKNEFRQGDLPTADAVIRTGRNSLSYVSGETVGAEPRVAA